MSPSHALPAKGGGGSPVPPPSSSSWARLAPASASRPTRTALVAGTVILACAFFLGGAWAPQAARLDAGGRRGLWTASKPVVGGGLATPGTPAAAAAAARADLQAVLAGAWAQVDLAPVDALSKALTRSLNVSGHLEGHSGEAVIERQVYYALASMPAIRTICEIGFNGGHSAALWLLANPTARVYMFDLWAHEYSPRGEAFLRGPKAAALGVQGADARLHIIKGPSQVTVPTFVAQHPDVRCDLLSVDGGHTYDMAMADLTNMASLASPGFNVLVVDDTNCAAGWCVDEAFAEQQRRGVVHRLAGYSEDANDQGAFMRGVTVAQYRNGVSSEAAG